MSTREQLEARWLTEEGKQVATEVSQALFKQASVKTLVQLVTPLPYIEEVAPALDLRGLNTEKQDLGFLWTDFSGAHLEYVYDIRIINGCQMRGTFLDGCYAVNSVFYEDFTRASFVESILQGVRFSDAKAPEANFTRAHLACAWLNRANFQKATFVDADMRFTFCPSADFRGADLSGADLTDASLGFILFDQETRLQGTNLIGTDINDDLRAFALESGAILGENQGAYDLAELDTTVKILRKMNTDGRFDEAIERLIQIRDHIPGHPMYPWISELKPYISQEILDEVLDVDQQAIKTMGYYL